MKIKDRANKIIAALQSKKDPLDAQRNQVWAELDKLLAQYKTQETALRDKIKELHAQVAPIDKLMAEASRAKGLKNDAVAKATLDAIEAEAK